MTNHFTPGNWITLYSRNTPIGVISKNGDDDHFGQGIAQPYFEYTTLDHCVTERESRANMHLISAAPQMLEILNELSEFEGSLPTGVKQKIKQVIKKALDI